MHSTNRALAGVIHTTFSLSLAISSIGNNFSQQFTFAFFVFFVHALVKIASFNQLLEIKEQILRNPDRNNAGVVTMYYRNLPLLFMFAKFRFTTFEFIPERFF